MSDDSTGVWDAGWCCDGPRCGLPASIQSGYAHLSEGEGVAVPKLRSKYRVVEQRSKLEASLLQWRLSQHEEMGYGGLLPAEMLLPDSMLDRLIKIRPADVSLSSVLLTVCSLSFGADVLASLLAAIITFDECWDSEVHQRIQKAQEGRLAAESGARLAQNPATTILPDVHPLPNTPNAQPSSSIGIAIIPGVYHLTTGIDGL